MPDTGRPLAAMRCDACGRDLAAAVMLIRCWDCRAVVMCADHVAATVTRFDLPGLTFPICAACVAVRAARPCDSGY